MATSVSGGNRGELLASRAGSGGEITMRRLHTTHADAVFRFLLKLTLGELPLAEDLLQETMMRAWRNISALDIDEEEQRRWLFTVARRVTIDAARARRVRPSEVGSADLNLVATAGDAAERVIAGHLVRTALPQISEEHRRVLTAIYFRGLTPSETAETLRIPEGTVKSRTYYALRALRPAIGRVDGE